MKLRISDLNDAGIDVCGVLAPAGLNERLNGTEDSGIVFDKPVQVTMHARRTAGGAELSGQLSGIYQQSCGRCLEPVAREFSIPATFLIKPRPRGERDLVDDVGVLYFSGEHCELESPLQETVLLSMSLYWSPEVDSAGKCGACKKQCEFSQGGGPDSHRNGESSNKGADSGMKTTRLGDLLKQLK